GHSGATGKIAPVGPVTRGVTRGLSPWAMRGVWLGVFLAATLGAGVGVLLALTHNGVDETVPPRPEQHGTVPRTARAHVPSARVRVTRVAGGPGTGGSGSTAKPGDDGAASAGKEPIARAKDTVKTARSEGTSRRHNDEEMPMTVVPADAPAPRV